MFDIMFCVMGYVVMFCKTFIIFVCIAHTAEYRIIYSSHYGKLQCPTTTLSFSICDHQENCYWVETSAPPHSFPSTTSLTPQALNLTDAWNSSCYAVRTDEKNGVCTSLQSQDEEKSDLEGMNYVSVDEEVSVKEEPASPASSILSNISESRPGRRPRGRCGVDIAGWGSLTHTENCGCVVLSSFIFRGMDSWNHHQNNCTPLFLLLLSFY